MTRAEAAEIRGVSRKRVTNMRSAGQLAPVTTPHRRIGVFDRRQVEALAGEREARQLEAERRRVQPRQNPSRPVLPPDQEATFEELMAAAE
jgi:hypothetical protein